jgi:hypothetical protein
MRKSEIPPQLTFIIHKFLGRYSIRAGSKSFGERVCPRRPRPPQADSGPRMSENTITANLHKIHELSPAKLRTKIYRLGIKDYFRTRWRRQKNRDKVPVFQYLMNYTHSISGRDCGRVLRLFRVDALRVPLHIR